MKDKSQAGCIESAWEPGDRGPIQLESWEATVPASAPGSQGPAESAVRAPPCCSNPALVQSVLGSWEPAC